MGTYNNLSEETIFEQFLNQEGRLNRWRYFKRIFVLAVVGFVLSVVIGMVFLKEGELINSAVSIASTVVGLILLYPHYCLILRRMKDLDKPLWLAKLGVGLSGVSMIFFNYDPAMAKSALGMLLALVGGILGLYFLFFKGTKGDNQYGPDPLG